jgi:hypothetical protein
MIYLLFSIPKTKQWEGEKLVHDESARHTFNTLVFPGSGCICFAFALGMLLSSDNNKERTCKVFSYLLTVRLCASFPGVRLRSLFLEGDPYPKFLSHFMDPYRFSRNQLLLVLIEAKFI